MAALKLHDTHNDLPKDKREKLVELLNQQLADTFDLASQVKQAHWNVKGPHFIYLHELFDKLHGEFGDYIDDIAERATTLGGVALGTARMASGTSRLPEYPADVFEGMQHVRLLVDRFAALAKTMRAAIDTAANLGDADTADLLTGVSRGLDKALWFLESHLIAK